MFRTSLHALLFASTLAAAHGPSRPAFAWTSAPVLNPDSGHYYAFFDASTEATWRNRPKLSFADALERASQMSHLGIPGHLVTITSQAEQDFIFETYRSLIGDPRSPDKTLGTFGRFWIGASDATVEGEWRWIAGPEAGQLFWRGSYDGVALDYHNWRYSINPQTLSEPNDYPQPLGLGEDFGSMRLGITPNPTSSYWNDVSTIDDSEGYVPRMAIVEFSPIPEPSTVTLIMCAFFSTLVSASRPRNHEVP